MVKKNAIKVVSRFVDEKCKQKNRKQQSGWSEVWLPAACMEGLSKFCLPLTMLHQRRRAFGSRIITVGSSSQVDLCAVLADHIIQQKVIKLLQV